MAIEHATALGAMSALRGQIEERLLQNEDFRALRALDRAIGELQMPPRPMSFATAPVLQTAGMPMVAGMGMPGIAVTETPSTLQQKISAKFSGSAA